MDEESAVMTTRTRGERPDREKLDEALEMTFPASDPVAVTPGDDRGRPSPAERPRRQDTGRRERPRARKDGR
jgi:hypothetical protein